MTDADDLADLAYRVVQIGARVAVAAVVVQTVLYLIDAPLPGSRRLLDADDDLSAFSWMSVVVTAFASLAALLVGALLRERPRRYYLLAVLLAFLSLDDMVQIHEEIGLRAQISGVEYSERILWPVIYLPILAATFVLLERIARSAHPTARRSIRAGLGLLAAALVLEVAAVAVLVEDDSPRLTAVYILEVAVEEAAELAGWIAIAAALAAILADGLAPPPARHRSAPLLVRSGAADRPLRELEHRNDREGNGGDRQPRSE